VTTASTAQDPDFRPDALRRAAELKAGCDDYGSDSYMAALEPLLFSLEREAELNALGRQELWGRIVAALANRLTVVAWEKDHPELAAAAIEAPLVVLGMPRTGSSILHETLASAPGMRTPLIWQVRDFALVQQVKDSRSDARVQAIDADIARKNEIVPGYAAIHHEDAHIPMECVSLTILDLVSIQFAVVAWSPTYRRFLTSTDARSAYDWHKRSLRYLQGNVPGGRWVLKAPMHSLYIDALMEAYPDALLVQTHRDPNEVIGSQCSLLETLRRPWSDRTDVTGHAAADVAYTAEGVRRALRYRRDHREIDARVFDLAFREYMADPGTVLARLYGRLGLELTDETRDAMIAYLNNRPREKYGKHSYSLDQFGLGPDKLAPLFAEYGERYRDYL
jgi:hypothetical protein